MVSCGGRERGGLQRESEREKLGGKGRGREREKGRIESYGETITMKSNYLMGLWMAVYCLSLSQKLTPQNLATVGF